MLLPLLENQLFIWYIILNWFYMFLLIDDAGVDIQHSLPNYF